MLITSNEQTDNLLGNAIGLYNDFFPQILLDTLSNFGSTELQIANLLAENKQFTEGVMGDAIDTEEMVNVLIGHYELTTDNISNSVATKEAIDFLTNRIDAKVGFGEIAVEATHFLLGPKVNPDSPEFTFPEFTKTADMFKNKISVAYTAAIKNDDIDDKDLLEDLIGGVVLAALTIAPDSGVMDLTDVNEYIEDFSKKNGIDLYTDKLAPVYYEVIDPDALKSLDPVVIESLDPVAMERLDSAVFEVLDPAVMKSLDPVDFEVLDPVAMESLDSAVFELSNPAVFEALNSIVPAVPVVPVVPVVPTAPVAPVVPTAPVVPVAPVALENLDPAAGDIVVEVLGASSLSADNFII